MKASADKPTVLIIGASPGLGLAMAEQYLARGCGVVATVRGSDRTALHELAESAGGRLEIENLDINVPGQRDALYERLAARRFDLLFVNAGVANQHGATTADISTDEFTRLMVTNALSPMRVVEALGDLVQSDGTIGVMSSGQGSVANNEIGGFEIYRASKSALNQLMRSYAARHRAEGRTLLLMAAGWVKTALGGPDARLTIDESIPSLVEVIDEQRGRQGLQYLDYRGNTVAW